MPTLRGDGKAPEWRRALVTGASSGIGRAFAVALATAGSNLVVVGRRADRLGELAAELQTAHGCDVEVVVADLTDADALGGVEGRLADGERPVDLLVNSAGFGTSGSFADLPLDREEAEIRLNVLAPVRLSKAALAGMLERGRGGIVNVSSVASLQPLPYWATYGATKAYLTSFSEAVHEEVRGRGVTVLALMPGFTHTEWHGIAGMPAVHLPASLWLSADQVATAGLRALRRGQAGHVVGLRYQIMATLSRMTPRAVSRRIVALGSHPS
ncbi:MAG: SDR family NAD(P)-dependent oxidoreductase [Acidimicrobiales bacterium]